MILEKTGKSFAICKNSINNKNPFKSENIKNSQFDFSLALPLVFLLLWNINKNKSFLQLVQKCHFQIVQPLMSRRKSFVFSICRRKIPWVTFKVFPLFLFSLSLLSKFFQYFYLINQHNRTLKVSEFLNITKPKKGFSIQIKTYDFWGIQTFHMLSWSGYFDKIKSHPRYFLVLSTFELNTSNVFKIIPETLFFIPWEMTSGDQPCQQIYQSKSRGNQSAGNRNFIRNLWRLDTDLVTF